MIPHLTITAKALRHLIRKRSVTHAGNRSLKIYGTLGCPSGRRMKKGNRVFFANEMEALKHGFRPCGHCLKQKYKAWKQSKNRVESARVST